MERPRYSLGMAENTAAQRFGREIVRLRQQAELTQTALGQAVGISKSLVSNLERGYRTPSPSVVKRLDEALSAHGHLVQLWETLSGSTRPAWLDEVTTLTRNARAVLEWQVSVFPGVLQTEAYARELIVAGTPWNTPKQAESAVRDRAARAAEFLASPRPLMWVVLDETVLTRRGMPDEVRREQFSHVLDLVDKGRISLQILPADVGGHPGLSGPFKLLTPDIGPDVVYAESVHEGRLVTAPEDVARYRLLFGRLQAIALPPVMSAHRLRDVRDAL